MDPTAREPRTHCIRCGECCLRSSPTLQRQDLHLVKNGWIQRKALFTIRKGEMVRDNIHGTMAIADHEMIKVKERGKDHGGCPFYDSHAKACQIYSQRPLQCVALECWDTEDFMRVYAGPKLARDDLIKDDVLRGFMKVHEKRCSYSLLESHVRVIEKEGEPCVNRILEVLKFDFHLRPFVSRRLGISAEEMDFIFGRPMINTISMFGLKVIKESDGTFFLTTAKQVGAA